LEFRASSRSSVDTRPRFICFGGRVLINKLLLSGSHSIDCLPSLGARQIASRPRPAHGRRADRRPGNRQPPPAEDPSCRSHLPPLTVQLSIVLSHLDMHRRRYLSSSYTLPPSPHGRLSVMHTVPCHQPPAAESLGRTRLRIDTMHARGGEAAQERTPLQQQCQHQHQRRPVTVSSSADSQPATMGDYQPGDLLGGKYIVRELLGRGSTGATYKVLPVRTPCNLGRGPLNCFTRCRNPSVCGLAPTETA